MNNNEKRGVDPVTGKQPGRLALLGLTVGMLLIVAGTLSPLMGGHVTLYRWIYGSAIAGNQDFYAIHRKGFKTKKTLSNRVMGCIVFLCGYIFHVLSAQYHA